MAILVVAYLGGIVVLRRLVLLIRAARLLTRRVKCLIRFFLRRIVLTMLSRKFRMVIRGVLLIFFLMIHWF